MGKAPVRDKSVYFLGAGFSKGFGLPLTSELLGELERMASSDPKHFLNRGHGKSFPVKVRGKRTFTRRLEAVVKVLYPDGSNPGYRPSVVDFFSSLSTYAGISDSFVATSFPGGKPREYLRLLKQGIARRLIEGTRENLYRLQESSLIDEIVQPGSIVITANWDLLIEAAAYEKGIPVRRALGDGKSRRSRELTLLKLHGSADWLSAESARIEAGYANDYVKLDTLQTRPRRGVQLQQALSQKDIDILRVGWNFDDLGSLWQRIGTRNKSPYIVTMSAGKSDELGPLRGVWRDAYSALSMARSIRIVGYSMPNDDTEIRTLLRAGVERGIQRPSVEVRNPAPDVHDRVRRYVYSEISSCYESVGN